MCSLTTEGKCTEASVTSGDTTVTLTTGEHDSKALVIIDTPGQIRVLLNDGTIWDANTMTHHHTECNCSLEAED